MAGACRHVGIIALSPCHLTFSSSGPNHAVVTVTVQHHINGTVVEHNDCGGAAGVAKISRRTNVRWVVTAGATSGNCEARFNFYHNGNKEGWALLQITNNK